MIEMKGGAEYSCLKEVLSASAVRIEAVSFCDLRQEINPRWVQITVIAFTFSETASYSLSAIIKALSTMKMR